MALEGKIVFKHNLSFVTAYSHTREMRKKKIVILIFPSARHFPPMTFGNFLDTVLLQSFLINHIATLHQHRDICLSQGHSSRCPFMSLLSTACLAL